MDATRRRLLAVTGSALATALAGCATGGGGTTTADSTSGGATTAPESDEPTASTTSADGSTTGEAPTDATSTNSSTDATTTESSTTDPSTETATGGETTSVTVGPDGDFRFAPDVVRIAVGDTVTWEWASGGHNVVPTAQPGGADWGGTEDGSGTTYAAGHEHSHTFTVAGRYEYHCAPHQSLGMTGSVVVE